MEIISNNNNNKRNEPYFFSCFVFSIIIIIVVVVAFSRCGLLSLLQNIFDCTEKYYLYLSLCDQFYLFVCCCCCPTTPAPPQSGTQCNQRIFFAHSFFRQITNRTRKMNIFSKNCYLFLILSKLYVLFPV